jgi:hypothetical protein
MTQNNQEKEEFPFAFPGFMARIKDQHPEIGDGWKCEWIGVCINVNEGDHDELCDRITELKIDGCSNEDAVEAAFKESITKCKPPEGHMFARITKAGEAPVLVVIAMPGTIDRHSPLYRKPEDMA